MTKDVAIITSDNVFSDLGINESEEYLQKADLAIRINDIICERKLTQSKAAALLGIDQPKVSLLKRGLLDAFSIERLMKLLRILGDEHEIRPKKRQPLHAANAGASQRFYYSNVAAQLCKSVQVFPAFNQIAIAPEQAAGLVASKFLPEVWFIGHQADRRA